MSFDLRARRRQATVDEIVEVAVTQMADTGAGGLSLGAVARTLGIRTPSLYTYFPSKAALYDEVFRRGWESYGALNAGTAVTDTTDLRTLTRTALTEAVRWATLHRPYAELMLWRPIPAWEPSAESYAAATVVLERLRAIIGGLREHGQIDPVHPTDEVSEVFATLVAGVITQHLSNDPGGAIGTGRASRHIHSMADMFATHYAAGSTP